MPGPDATAALRTVAAVGPYFSVETDAPDDAAWRPLGDLLHDPAVVAERVAAVRATLAERTGLAADGLDLRACASIHFLGLASRLVAPVLAAAAVTGVVPRPAEVRWQAVAGGPVPVSFDEIDAVPVRTAADAGAAVRDVVDGLVGPLVAAFARGSGVTVSTTVLWGNVASALAGATGMLLRSDATPALDPLAVATAALTDVPLAGTGGFGVDGRFFRRANCCLFYRVPGGGTCGDCVLD